MKIKITFIMTLYIIFLSIYTVHANNDYVCSTYSSECKNVVWEKNTNGTWKFRADGTNHGFGTKTTITRYGNTRVGCPKITDKNVEVPGSSPNRVCSGGNLFGEGGVCNWVCPAGETLSSGWDSYYCVRTKKIGGAYGTIGFGNYGGFGYGDKNNGEESCELVRYDTSVPDITVTKTSVGTGSYRASATCKDDSTNIVSGKLGNSGCSSNSILDEVIYESGAVYTFVAEDNAGNTRTAIGTGTGGTSTETEISCETRGDCIPVNVDEVILAGNCSDDDNPVAELTYSIDQCTNQDVVVTNTCKSDATCGCRAAPEDKATLTIGANSHNTLGIADKAGNVTDLPWTVNWIDKVSPSNLQFAASNQKASENNFFMISVRDNNPVGLCNNLYLDYELDITGPENKTLTGKVKYDETPTTGMLGLTKVGTYDFSLRVTDQAGNVITKNNIPSITIKPGDLSATGTTLTVSTTGDKYADNTTSYTYTLTLKDEFENLITGKQVDLINQECASPSCKTIKTNMTDNTGDDALIESDYSEVTGTDGKVTFILKSLTPGEFTQRFKVSMNTWDNDYVDTSETQSIIETVSGINYLGASPRGIKVKGADFHL